MKNHICEFEKELSMQEIKPDTVRKYMSDLERFMRFAGGENAFTRETTRAYREMLLSCYKPATAVSYLMTVNRFFAWMGREDLCVRLPRQQKRYSLDRTLSEDDYRRMLSYTRKYGKLKYYCIMRTLAGTGMRVGELKFVTREAVSKGSALISNKNKLREICFTDELSKLLEAYANEKQIQSGILFMGRNTNAINPSSVWKTLKRIASKCGVNEDCVYPHSFRHLLARTYMKKIGNITELADILGHSSLETTRIYTMGTKEEKRAELSELGL